MKLSDIEKFQTISTDTRTLKIGDIFLALKGPNFDGHNFITEAETKGAKAVIVSQNVRCSIPVIMVNDTMQAFGELAATRRQQLNIPVIALTGSCGKTTTKTLIAAILQQSGNTLATEANLNNNIGVALTLLRLTPEYKFAVIEVGANIVGEIAYATNLLNPDIALITKAAPVHLTGFNNLDGVAQEKGKLLLGLKADGCAILNADDYYFNYWQKLLTTQRYATFALQRPADITAKNITVNQNGTTTFTLITPHDHCVINLAIIGEHNIANALAATAVAYTLNIPLSQIKAGLEKVMPITKRIVIRQGYNGSTIIDDSYGANPVSMQAAIKTLIINNDHTKILVMGEMRELGNDAEYYHQELGMIAKQLGVDFIFGIGDLSRLTTKVFGTNGYFFTDRQELIKRVRSVLEPKVTVLVKGSNANRMWEIVAGLIE